MAVPITHHDRARSALPRVVRALRELAGNLPAELPVTARWTVADTVAHLCTIAALDVALIRDDSALMPVPGIEDRLADTTVDTVKELNAMVLSTYAERDTGTLLGLLDRDVIELLDRSAAAGAPAMVGWLGDARLPVGGLLAHLLNELDLHGWDIARAAGRPWRSDPAGAALFVHCFLAELARHGYGHLLDREGPARPGRISVTFRSGYCAPTTLALVDGAVRLEAPDPQPDVRLTYDPVTLNRMLFGRVSRARAVLTGKVRIGGRRPWLLPAFEHIMRLPS